MKRLLAILFCVVCVSHAVAQRGGSLIRMRAYLPDCTAITGSCPQDNWTCVYTTDDTIYRCETPSTWTQLSAAGHSNGANCSAGQFPLGVDGDGAVESCTDTATQAELDAWIGSANVTTLGTIGTGTWQGTAIADAYVPNNITITLAATATALAANGADCSAGQFPLGVDESGAVASCTDAATQAELDAWVGSANVTTLGTIGTGTWQGTAIADGYVPDTITIDHSTTGTMRLDQVADCSGVTTEGQICWDTDDDLLYIGDGAAAQSVGSSFDSTAVDDTTWSDGATEAAIAWTFNLSSGTDPVMTAENGNVDFSTAVTATSFTADASATPSLNLTDSDTDDEDVSASMDVNCTTTGTGAEDCDISLVGQLDGADETVIKFDADDATSENLTLGTANVEEVIIGSPEFEIPNGAAAVVDTAGEVGVDTTDDQFIYYGGSKRVVTYKHSKDLVLESPADADAFIFHKAQDAITITDIECIVDPAGTGESAVIDIQECDGTADNCATVDATITCDNDGAADDGTFTNGTIDAGDWLNLDIGTVTGTVTALAVTIYYTVDAE